MNGITIGYLSWKRYNIFEQTLNSHKMNGLFDIIDHNNRIIFFQELSQFDINIANKYNCKFVGDSNNIGILNAFIKLVEKCTTEYFIFSENDWLLIENKDTTKKILKDSVELLEKGLCDIVKLRHRKNHGIPLYSKPTNPDEWMKQNISKFPYKLESLSWVEKPNDIYNNTLFEFDGNYKWYITTLEHQKWSNNIFIAKTKYLRDIVLPLLKKFIDNNNRYTGLEDILINYNKYLGHDIDFDNIINLYDKTKLAGGEGLFTHKDEPI